MTTKQIRVSRTELARLIRATPDRVGKYIAEGMPVLETGNGRGRRTWLDLGEVLPWLLERRTGTFDEARTRYYQAQASKVETENRVRSGELVEAAEASRHLVDAGVITQAKLRGLPSALADRLVGAALDGGQPAVYRLLRTGIDDALWELAVMAGLPDTRRKDTP